MHRLRQGQVVNVEIADPRGQNKKLRPVVILTATHEISDEGNLVVAAISTKLADPLPADWISVPWSRDGHAGSGLTEPSVVKCHWLVRVTTADVVSVRGYLRDTDMQNIMAVVSKS